jgi:hypothetical protein
MPADAAWAELIAAAALHGTAFQGPATQIYVELVSDTPTASVNGTPVVYTGYAGRVAMLHTHWTGDSAGGRVSNADVTFPPPTAGTPDTATFVEFWSAGSGGYRLAYQELDAPLTCDSSLDSVVFPAGTLQMVFGQ